MYEFSAKIVNNKIEIESNTYWSCKADGNFKLSKYDGSGNAIINIDIPKDIIVAKGIVYFSYGDERCDRPTLDISIANTCYIETTPNYQLCDEQKTIYLFFNEGQEACNISVRSYSNWQINNVVNANCITSNNDIIVIFGNENGGFTIELQGCGDDGIIYVKTIKKADS